MEVQVQEQDQSLPAPSTVPAASAAGITLLPEGEEALPSGARLSTVFVVIRTANLSHFVLCEKRKYAFWSAKSASHSPSSSLPSSLPPSSSSAAVLIEPNGPGRPAVAMFPRSGQAIARNGGKFVFPGGGPLGDELARSRKDARAIAHRILQQKLGIDERETGFSKVLLFRSDVQSSSSSSSGRERAFYFAACYVELPSLNELCKLWKIGKTTALYSLNYRNGLRAAYKDYRQEWHGPLGLYLLRTVGAPPTLEDELEACNYRSFEDTMKEFERDLEGREWFHFAAAK